MATLISLGFTVEFILYLVAGLVGSIAHAIADTSSGFKSKNTICDIIIGTVTAPVYAKVIPMGLLTPALTACIIAAACYVSSSLITNVVQRFLPDLLKPKQQ